MCIELDCKSSVAIRNAEILTVHLLTLEVESSLKSAEYCFLWRKFFVSVVAV